MTEKNKNLALFLFSFHNVIIALINHIIDNHISYSTKKIMVQLHKTFLYNVGDIKKWFVKGSE